MNPFHDFKNRFNTKDLKTKAVDMRKEWSKEFKNMVKNIKKIDLNLADNAVVESVRENFSSALSRVQDLEVLEFAKEKAQTTKNQVFQFLNIPSQSDVKDLTRKLVNLEKKVKSMNRH